MSAPWEKTRGDWLPTQVVCPSGHVRADFRAPCGPCAADERAADRRYEESESERASRWDDERADGVAP